MTNDDAEMICHECDWTGKKDECANYRNNDYTEYLCPVCNHECDVIECEDCIYP